MIIPDIRTLLRKARVYTRKLWVRVVAIGLMSFVALGLAVLLERLVPEELARTLNGQSADRLLQIIANAMLAVTTFSLTVMVTVYRASSNQWTPRVHRLIIQDRTTQNTLAVFIGAYVYALLAIILRELGVFVDKRAFVLFVMTVAVLAVIVVYLIRWVLHLQTFGSLIDATRQIEEATRDCFEERLKNPCMGANPLTGDVPKDAENILADQTGYVQFLHPEVMQSAAEAHGKEVYMLVNIGSFVFLNEPLAAVVDTGNSEKDTDQMEYASFEDALRASIVIGDVRTFDQDPRFGLITMGEVASKALSPGINDSGTAIDVIHRISRILSSYEDETQQTAEDLLSRLYVAPLDPADLLEDGFGSLSRDGVAVIEVQQRLQTTFAGLRRHPDPELSRCAREAAEVALERALRASDFGPDQERLMASAEDDVLKAVQKNMKAESR